MNPVFTTIGKILIHPGMHTALGIANLTVSSIDLKKTCDVESKVSSANSNFTDAKKSIEILNENVDSVSADISSLRLSTKDLPKFMEDTSTSVSRIDKLFADMKNLPPVQQPTAPTAPTVPTAPSVPDTPVCPAETVDDIYRKGVLAGRAEAEAERKKNEEAAAAKAEKEMMISEIADLKKQLTAFQQGTQTQTQAPANDSVEDQLTLQLLTTLKTLSTNSATEIELLKQLGTKNDGITNAVNQLSTKIDAQNEGITNAVNMTNQMNSCIAALNATVNNDGNNSKTNKK